MKERSVVSILGWWYLSLITASCSIVHWLQALRYVVKISRPGHVTWSLLSTYIDHYQNIHGC